LVVLVEGAPPEVMDGEAKDDHLEGVSCCPPVLP
jgi:hypothetical protein